MKTENRSILEDRPALCRVGGDHRRHRLWSAWLRYRRWCAARRAIRHLRELDAYLLVDIGIERREIAAVAHGGKRPAQGSGQRIARPSPPNTRGKLAA